MAIAKTFSEHDLHGRSARMSETNWLRPLRADGLRAPDHRDTARGSGCDGTSPDGSIPLSVTILSNFIPPYRRQLLMCLANRLKRLQILLSVEMEEGRHWRPDHAGLDVAVQKTWTLSIRRRHPHGFHSVSQIHLPLDTLLWLWRGAPDVVISGELGFRTLAATLYRIVRPGARLIIWTSMSIASEKGVGFIRRTIRRLMLLAADSVIVNGNEGRTYIETLGFPAHRTFSVPYTIDLDIFRMPPSGEWETTFRLLYVGQLVERKGLLPFLRALWKWAIANQGRSIDIWVAGDGPLKGQIESMTVPANASLRMLGNVEYEQLPRIYRQAGILVFPTLADEWGVVVNEAMAMGVPVMGSIYSAAVQELVTDGATGWKFIPTEEQSTIQCIDRVMRTPSVQLEKMRGAAADAARTLTTEAAADIVMRAVASVHRSRSEAASRGRPGMDGSSSW